MKRNKMKKGFWTLNRHNSEGFTLVELIVVIAILAILAGVGVPVYSGYVTRANKQADQTLVNEVANALVLHYYANPNNASAGYVVLSAAGAEPDTVDGFADKAMEAAFGENWETIVALKHSGWTTDAGLMQVALKHSAEELKTLNASSFLNDANTEGMLNAVSGLTNLVGDVINTKSPTAAKSRENLVKLFGEDSDIVGKLDELQIAGLKEKDYPTAISNMLVNYMADTIETEPYMQTMLNMYASAYAYGAKTGDYAALEQMNKTLENITMGDLMAEGMTDEDAANAGLEKIMTGMMGEDADGNGVPNAGFEGFVTYMENEGENQMVTDNNALGIMMGAVKQISGNYMDVKNVTNADLYTSGDVADQVTTYLNAVKVLASMDKVSAVLDDLEEGSIAVFVTENGVVSAIPSAAWLASK